MLTLQNEPLVKISEATVPCFVEPSQTLCEPCRQVNTYLPKLKAPTTKQNPALEALAKAFLQLDDKLMDAICGLCLSADVSFEDCQCLIDYGKSIGAPLYYRTIDSDYCMRFGSTETIRTCCHEVSDGGLEVTTPQGFTAWKIPDASYSNLGCPVSAIEILSYSDDWSGISVGTGTQSWLTSQDELDNFLQIDEQNYPSPIQGDLLIGSFTENGLVKPCLFVKDGSIINKATFYFLLQCNGGSLSFYTFTEQIQPGSGGVTTTVCSKEMFVYCHQLCQECNIHLLDPCGNEQDFELYKKIVKFKAKWFNKAPTRKNIVDALVDWFGPGAYVLDATYPNIYWSLGRVPTAEELGIMPFVYSMMPVYDGIEFIFTEEL